MRVLHLGKFYPPHHGGIETHLKTLCEGLSRHVTVEVLVANDEPRETVEMFNGVAVQRLRELMRLAAAPICPALIRHIRNSRADLIHLHAPNPFAAVALMMSGNRAPLVISWHSDIVRQRFARTVFASFERQIVRGSAALIASSPEYIASSPILARNRDHCHVIPHGVRADDYRDPQTETIAYLRNRYGQRIVLAVGRLVYYKGFEYLIRAMRRIEGHLLIVGEGPRRHSLEREATLARLGGCITFLGALSASDLIACYHAADIFVLPSIARSEAFGIVQLEAMACGKPVINTRIDSGVPFVSVNGETGLTVAPGSSDALAIAINTLLESPELRVRYGTAAARRVREHFSFDMMVSRTFDLYERLLDGNARTYLSARQVGH